MPALVDHIDYQVSQTALVRDALTDSAVAVAALAGEVNGDFSAATTLAHLELLEAEGVAQKNRGKWSLA